MIEVLVTYVRREIQREIEAEMYFLLLEETTDVLHQEQVLFVVRYLHHIEIRERFIEMCIVDTTTGQELENAVLSLLLKNGLQLKICVAMGTMEQPT